MTSEIFQRAGVDCGVRDDVRRAVEPVEQGPIHDLDMASYALVKSLAGRLGNTYPDMPWEPKESFRAVAGWYGARDPSPA